MPKYNALPDWSGEDVFVIGGGNSLEGFDWNQMKRLNTIGCNQAFFLGSSVCKIAAFGDEPFWQKFRADLEMFNGWVATNLFIGGVEKKWPWLNVFERINDGFSNIPDCLAWNYNTGAMATNLAIVLGAKRVFLLGMDMCKSAVTGKTHWHDKKISIAQEQHYTRFKDGFSYVKMGIDELYSDRLVINVTEGSSELNHFERRTFSACGLKAPTKQKVGLR